MAVNFADVAVQKVKSVASSLGKKVAEVVNNPQTNWFMAGGQALAKPITQSLQMGDVGMNAMSKSSVPYQSTAGTFYNRQKTATQAGLNTLGRGLTEFGTSSWDYLKNTPYRQPEQNARALLNIAPSVGRTLMGAGQTVASVNPLVMGLRGVASTPQARNMNVNLPVVGQLNVPETLTSMVEFTKDPAWKAIFPVTSKFLGVSPTNVKLLDFLIQRTGKGGVEGIIQGWSTLPEKATTEEKVNHYLINAGFGAASEITFDAFAKSIGYVGDKVKLKNIIANLSDRVSEDLSKLKDYATKPAYASGKTKLQVDLQGRKLQNVSGAFNPDELGKTVKELQQDTQPKGVGGVEEGINAWKNNQIYYDGNGNYRWGKSMNQRMNLPEGATPGQIVPFNKEIKSAFKSVDELHQASKGVGGVAEGGVSSRKGNYKAKLDQDVAQISKPILEKQLKGEISTPTKATKAVSSTPIIRQKGQLNIERLNVKGQGKKQLKSIESKVKPTVIGNKEVIKASITAKGTGPMSDSQMKDLLAQQLKNRQKVVDLSVRFNQAKRNGATDTELGKIMLDMVNESRTARQGGTFAGRLLQAQNIIADQSASPTQKILALLNNAGIPESKYLKDATKLNWDNPNEVVAFYRKYVPPKFGELLDEFRYSNMLSSPLTHIINTASNALQTGPLAAVEKTITGVLDWGKSTLTGSERQYYVRSGIDYAGGYVKSLPQAFKKAWNVLRGSENLTKPDFERVPLGTTGVMKAYSTPLRALEAMDQFFKTLVEGGVTSELKNGPQRLPLSQIADEATKQANYRLFRQAFDPDGKLGQGPVLQLFDKWNSAIANVRRLPGGKWVMPFLQTPTNILKQGIEYSPLGATTAIGAKAPLEQLSKAIIGTGVFMGAYQLAQNGLISWESPSSETERELYYAAGMQPYSVKIGENWVSFSKLGPISYPIAMAAAIVDAEKKNPDKDMVANLTSGVSGILGFFGDQSYVRSIGDLVDAIQGGVNVGPTALSAEGANLAGQLIPYKSFLTWLGRITDPTYRKASGFTDRLKKDIPIIGEKLEPYTDIYGKPSVRDYPILNAVSPYKVTQEKATEKPMLDKYQEAKIKRGVEKRADEKFMAGDREAPTGQVFRYLDEDGTLKKIDTSKVSALPSNTPYEKAVREQEAYKLADDILKLEKPEDQAKAFYDLGISPEDAVYYTNANQDNRIKSLYLDEEIGKLDTNNRANLINFLISQRKEVNGKMVLSNGEVLDGLEDAGLISEAEKTMLKNLKIVDGKPVTKLTGRGKKTALKKVSMPSAPTKIKAPNMKTLLASKGKLKVKKYKFRRTL